MRGSRRHNESCSHYASKLEHTKWKVISSRLRNPPLDLSEILAETEKTFVSVFRKIGPLVESHKLEDECLRQGMNQASFSMNLSNSPIISRFARCVYGLRGTEISPGQAEAVPVQLRKTRVLSDYGWTKDGKIFLSYKLSSGTLANGIVSVPAGMKKHLSGAYDTPCCRRCAYRTVSHKRFASMGTWPSFPAAWR